MPSSMVCGERPFAWISGSAAPGATFSVSLPVSMPVTKYAGTSGLSTFSVAVNALRLRRIRLGDAAATAMAHRRHRFLRGHQAPVDDDHDA
jgi:hypothetical protein